MTWIALSTEDQNLFSLFGVDAMGADKWSLPPDSWLARGTLMVETRLPPIQKPQSLIQFKQGGGRRLNLSLQAIPGGGLTFVLDQNGRVLHQSLNGSETGRFDILRISYAWNLAADWARLALERADLDRPIMVEFRGPSPLNLEDVAALARNQGDCDIAPDVLYLAVSDAIEPVGPTPTLLGNTPIRTPFGYMPAEDLARGDLVVTPDGQTIPILHALQRVVPAEGSFSPVCLRTPYFGLQEDIHVAQGQRLVISGSEVEYTFGCESVLAPVRHFIGGHAAYRPDIRAPLATYVQFVLPEHDVLDAAGVGLESLFIGRMRRRASALEASLLSGIDRKLLPEHPASIHPVLSAFDATVLAERRVA